MPSKKCLDCTSSNIRKKVCLDCGSSNVKVFENIVMVKRFFFIYRCPICDRWQNLDDLKYVCCLYCTCFVCGYNAGFLNPCGKCGKAYCYYHGHNFRCIECKI